MNDLWAIGLAVATAAGAWSAHPVPLWAGGLVTVAGLGARRPALVCIGVALLAAGLAARAWTGAAPVRVTMFDGVVTLLDDPQSVGAAIRVQVRADGHHLEAWARGSAARRLAPRQAGERVAVTGEIGPAGESVRRRLAERHIAGQLQVERVIDHDDGNPASRAANRIRTALTDGAEPMSPAERALFTGFVLGDDRAEPPELVDDFRAAGLSHLTAVSGENLAFLMVLTGPLLRRLRLTARFAATIGLIGWFALLTRFEPSVLRAAAMAALAALAFVLARPASTIRLLALAVTAMVLVDPLLVWSVGWWLSVGATAGIAVVARPLAFHLPGPRALAQAAAVTVAAQVGVAPVSLGVFGGIPVVSVPANLLAVPVAGPLMVWGLPAGILAGLVPSLAPVLHVPTRLGVRWIALVARIAARAPLGEIRAVHIVPLGVAAAAVLVGRRVSGRGGVGAIAGALGGAIALAVVISVVPTGPLPPLSGAAAGDGARMWRSGGATVLVADRADNGLLAALRALRVERLDVVVATARSPDLARALEPVLRQYQPGIVLAPPGSRLPTARVPDDAGVTAGDLGVVVTVADDHLDVDVVSAPRHPG